MKKTLALLLSLTLLLSLSACSMLKDIKENAERNAAREILETPAEADAPALFLDAVKNGFADAHVVKEHTSMEIGRPTVEGEGDVDLLNAAAGLLKDLIADGAPGSETREVTDIADTELQGFDPAGATETRLDRKRHIPVDQGCTNTVCLIVGTVSTGIIQVIKYVPAYFRPGITVFVKVLFIGRFDYMVIPRKGAERFHPPEIKHCPEESPYSFVMV